MVSLQRKLLLWLLLPQLVLWLAGGVVTYRLAAGYANRAIDASLAQSSRALLRQVKPIEQGLLIDFPRAAQEVLEADPKDRVMYTVSTPPGPTSRNVRTPSAYICSISLTKLTGRANCDASRSRAAVGSAGYCDPVLFA